MNTLDAMRGGRRAALLTLATTMLIGAAVQAHQIEETVVVPRGTTAVTVVFDDIVLNGHGPFHGSLLGVAPSGLLYTPGASFWEARSDLAILPLHKGRPDGATSLRLRFVVGEPTQAGEVFDMGDLTNAPPLWKPWTVVGTIQTEPGALGHDAYVVQPDPIDPARLEAVLVHPDPEGPASGNDGTASSGTVHVTVRDIGTAFPPYQSFVFYRIHENGTTIFELEAYWNAGAWYLRPAGVPNPPSTLLDLGRTRIRVERWTSATGDDSGTTVLVDDGVFAEVDTPPHSSETPDTHVITALRQTGGAAYELMVERPRGYRATLAEDPRTVLVQDNLDGGPDSTAWTRHHLAPQSFPNQDLPGHGDRFDVELGLLTTLQSSYLQHDLGLVANALDPAGYGVSFWVDPTGVTMPAPAQLGLLSACPLTGPCGAIRVRLDTDAAGFRIVLTAMRGDFTVAQMATPVSNAPHRVEVRMRNASDPSSSNGWAELWVDGQLIGRADDLTNHSTQIQRMLFGGLSQPGQATGPLGLDDFELWRFDR